MPCRMGIVCPLCHQDWDGGEKYSIADAVAALLNNHKELRDHHFRMEADYVKLRKRIEDIENAEQSLRIRSQHLKKDQEKVSEKLITLSKERAQQIKEFTKQELLDEILRR